MRLTRFSLLFVISLVMGPFSPAALAQTNSYPANSRATFLTGCLLDDSPNFRNDSEVYQLMRTCVCMLDQFQTNYSHQQFMTLFAAADKNQQPQKQELDAFFASNLSQCL